MFLALSLDPARGLLERCLANVRQNGFWDSALHFNVAGIKHAGRAHLGRVVFNVPVSRHIVKVGRLVVIQVPRERAAVGRKGVIVIGFVLAAEQRVVW